MRREMITQLKEWDLVEHTRLSQEITKNLIQSTTFQQAKMIGLTISRNPEVDTYEVIQRAWEMDKQIVVPRCHPQTREMDFRRLTSFDQLEVVYMDLLEPILGETTSVIKEQIDLQIVPGLVFSNAGYRIGFGGGYYDRYLSDYAGKTISLCFERQTGYNIPIEAHDQPVEKIITELREINCDEIRDSK